MMLLVVVVFEKILSWVVEQWCWLVFIHAIIVG